MKCPMCDVGIATVEFKSTKICAECYKMLHSNFENVPVIHNDTVIGVVKSKVGNVIECMLWENFVGIETMNGKCSAVIVSDDRKERVY